jgi:hypothetical protein
MPEYTAQPRAADDAANGEGRIAATQRAVAEPLMGALVEVVVEELGDQMVQMPRPEGNEVVQALTADRAHPALGEGVELGRAGRELLGRAAAVPERCVEGASELPVAIAEQNRGRCEALVQCGSEERLGLQR